MAKKQPGIKAKRQPQSYWERRADARMDAALRDSQKTLDILSKAYRRAVEDIEEDIYKIHRTFTRAFDLDPQKARELLDAPCSREEYLKILSTIDQITDERVRNELLAQASSGAYKARLSRLESLRQSVGAQAMRLADIESGLATDTLAHTITETFNRTMYDIQRGTGLGFAFSAPDTRAVGGVWMSSTGALTTGAQVVYKLPAPRYIQAGQIELGGLDGETVVYSNGERITATSLEDPKYRAERVNARLAALESAVTNQTI